MTDVKFLNADKLCELQMEGKNIAIIDVRDSEREDEGYIAGSSHYPSRSFANSLPELLEDIKGKEAVFVHCSFSQVRGPSAARALANSIAEAEGEAAGSFPPVYVLENGFRGWQAEGRPVQYQK